MDSSGLFSKYKDSHATTILPALRASDKTFAWNRIANDIHTNLYDLLQANLCTDFEIEVEDKSFRCHKVVLAAVSDYFKALFRSGMKEVKDSKVKLPGVTSETIDILLSILYPKSYTEDPFLNATDDEMIELCNLASRFQIMFLSHACLEYFGNTTGPRNCTSRWQTAKAMNCDVIRALCFEFLVKNFIPIIQNEHTDLLLLQLDDLLSILQHEALNIDQEKDIWNLIMAWIDFDKDARQFNFLNLLQACSLTQIEHNFLIEEIAFHPLVRANDTASGVVRDAIRFKTHREFHANLELNLRPCYGKVQWLLMLIRESQDNTSFIHVVKSRPTTGWHKTRIGLTVEPPLACCAFDETLYVLPDNGTLYQLEDYDTKFTFNRCIGESLKGHTMSVANDSIYILGGKTSSYSTTKVFKLKKDSQNYVVDGYIIAPVVNASSVSINNKIYLIGGISYTQPVSCVQVYDTQTQTGTIFSSLPKPVVWSRAVCRGDTAYIVTSDGDVLEMSVHDRNCHIIATIPDFRRINFGIDLRKTQIIIIGGKDTKPYPLKLVFDEEVEDDGDEEEKKCQNAAAGESDDDVTDEFEGYCHVTDRVVSVDILNGAVEEMDPLPGRWEVLGCTKIIQTC